MDQDIYNYFIEYGFNKHDIVVIIVTLILMILLLGRWYSISKDTLALKQLIEANKQYNCNILCVGKVPNELVSNYGIIKYQGKYDMWQLCSDGKVDGINTFVDIDVLYSN